MKRIITLTALVLAVMVHAAAATYYGFYLGGVKVTSDNCNNITGSNITAYGSTYPYSAVYNPSTKTLTLNNVSIERSGSYNRAILNESCAGLTVVFEGGNRMEAEDSSPLRFNAATTLTSPNGNLTVSGGSEDAITVGSGAKLTITDALIRVYSNSHGIIGDTGNETLVISETNIDVKCEKEDYNSLRDFKSLSVISSRVSLRTTSLAPAVVNLKAFTMSGDRMCTLMQTYDAQKKTFVFPGGGTSYYGYIAPAVAFSDRSVFPDENFANELSPPSGLILDDYKMQYIVLPSKHHAGTAGGQWKILGPLSKNIYSLKGIEYVTDLQELYCDSLQLTSLDLSANTKLKTLWCSVNKLTTLTLPDSNLLTTLHCDHNRLTSLDLSKYIMLEDLRCNSNPLTTLNITASRFHLASLRCDSCNLSSLDLSQHVILKTLRCNDNKLKSLSLPNSESLLEYMDCSNNQLTTLNVTGTKFLQDLNCSNNQLTTLATYNLPQLTKLQCQNNRIASLDLTKNSELVEPDCSNNQLTTLNFTWCTKLGNTIKCYGNQITGDGMTQLVESLPNSPYTSNLFFANHQDPNEGNSAKALQVTNAQAKRWNLCHLLPKDTEYTAIELECYPTGVTIAGHPISACYCGYIGQKDLSPLFDELSGTVKYNPQGYILTLDNATIMHNSRGIQIGKENKVMVIKLLGTNNINLATPGIAISSANCSNHYINGGGTLNINMPAGTTMGTAIYVANTEVSPYHRLHIENCTLNVNGTADIMEDDGDNNITIDSATVRLSYGSIAMGYDLELIDCYINKPAGGHVERGSLCAAGSNSYFTGEIEILPGAGFIKGDVNGDGAVNVSDVTALVNMILGTLPKDEARADVNGDGVVNVSDVTALVNIILGVS